MKRRRLSLPVRLLLWVLILGVLPLTGLWMYVAQPVWRQQDVSPLEVSPEVLQQHVRTLSETYHPRSYLHRENLEQCAGYIEAVLRESGGVVTSQEVSAMNHTSRNVICSFDRGHDAWLILGAHYDSYGNTPGADDNASGVAVLLEVARLIGSGADPGVNVEVVAYTYEEPPFFGTESMGSHHHAEALKGSGRSVKGMIALEMLGFYSDEPGSQSYPIPALHLMYPDTGDFIAVIGKLDQRSFTRKVKAGMKGVTPLEIHSMNAPTRLQGIDFSDHRNYWAFGYDAVMITNTAFYRNEHYHHATDTADRLDYTRMAQATVAVVEMLAHL